MAKAYALIVNDSGTEDSVISNLNYVSSITGAFGTFGVYDILTTLESDDEQRIENDISNQIRKINNIRSTLTLFVDAKPGLSKTTEIEREILSDHMAQAFAVIHCSKSYESSIMQNLDKIPEIVESDVLIGTYEIICKIAVPTYNNISELVSKKIRKIPGIKSTMTINVINHQGFSR